MMHLLNEYNTNKIKPDMFTPVLHYWLGNSKYSSSDEIPLLSINPLQEVSGE